jgi:hypothetical protein
MKEMSHTILNTETFHFAPICHLYLNKAENEKRIANGRQNKNFEDVK